MKSFVLLLACVAICFVAGFIGSVFTVDSIPTWYASLNKPFFNPPNWIFGPVWTTLYMLMGYSLYLVLTSKKIHLTDPSITLFALQLILNALWSIVFFGLHLPGIAFIVLVCLWISIYMTIREFFSRSTLAGRLLIPYICWVTFAGVLNMSIVLLN